ncbi:MAG: cytochrome c [Betaproteobacteria bacterium]|nr:cytochrome c [Betaproteobacteria bacterium]NCA16170.1 cytochrome c [Betaproteobacteria bacterium]
MSKCARGFLILAGVAAFMGVASAAQPLSFQGIGRAATPAEIAAWDIDVRPDFKGLPVGSGSVSKGQEVWESKCAGCHGIFGESGEVFTPIVGGTTAADIASGRVANLRRLDFPQRTTLMKVATVSTLWDYVNRAMPWTTPKSLSVEEVYAVVGYMLHLGDIIPADFVLSNINIASVQARMPNRLGMTTDHGLLDVKGRPDVRNVACMKDCAKTVEVSSFLPLSALDSHGNLAEQNRGMGPARGMNTQKAKPN